MQTTLKEAMQICCSYGLQLLAVETPEEAACLQQLPSVSCLLFLPKNRKQ